MTQQHDKDPGPRRHVHDDSPGIGGPLPGDLPQDEVIERMIRVNQAGEYGAKRIYAGQLAVLKGRPCEETIRHMDEQEQQHLDYFNDEVSKRHIRPTVMQPIWHVGGWLLGAATAAMGEKAAMACTAAVESVIDEHYQQQSAYLDDVDEEASLKSTIDQFRAEEAEHHDTAIEYGAEEAPLYAFLSAAIRTKTKMAIWLSTRI